MSYGAEVVGSRLTILWTGDRGKPWFAGRVTEWRPYDETHLITYDDGDQKAHCLGDEEANGQLRWEKPRKRKLEQEAEAKVIETANTAAKKPAQQANPKAAAPANVKKEDKPKMATNTNAKAKVMDNGTAKGKAKASPAAVKISAATVDMVLKENDYDYSKLGSRAWPKQFGAGGAVLPLLEKGGARFNTIAIGPPVPGGKWNLGYAAGCRGPSLSLFCWGGGEASLAGLSEEPSNTGDCFPGHSMKWDALVARGSKGEVALLGAGGSSMSLLGAGGSAMTRSPCAELDDPVFGRGAFFANALGQSMCGGFHGALVRKVKPGQTFEVADPNAGLGSDGPSDDIDDDDDNGGEGGGPKVAETITTKEGDIEVLIMANSISSNYCVPHLMRAENASYDKKEAAKEFDGGDGDWWDWFGCGKFGMW